jgi:hypothetical protein
MRTAEEVMDWTIGVVEEHEAFAWPDLRTVAAAHAFTEALASRYAALTFTASRGELALAYDAPAQFNNFHSHFHGGPEITVSPAVNIHEERAFAVISREIAATGEPTEGYGEAQAAALFERLFSRRARVEAFSPPRETARPGDPVLSAKATLATIPQSDDVERIVSRATSVDKVSARVEGSSATAAAARDSGWGTPAAFPEAPKPATLPAPEVKRVAEQVMREIDRRMIARRERMGKR